MIEGWLVIVIGTFFAVYRKGGRGEAGYGGLTLKAGAGVVLIVIGAVMLSW